MKEMQRVATTSDRMREAMAAADMKQIELAAATGISHSSISRYLSGIMEPKAKAVSKMAAVLGVSEMWLWGYDVPRVRSSAQKKNDVLVDVIKQLRIDPDFFEVVSQLAELPPEEYGSIKLLISSLRKKQLPDEV